LQRQIGEVLEVTYTVLKEQVEMMTIRVRSGGINACLSEYSTVRRIVFRVFRGRAFLDDQAINIAEPLSLSVTRVVFGKKTFCSSS
jgi:hypothetical protein